MRGKKKKGKFWGGEPNKMMHLEPDIVECEVKWALGSITMNKASGGEEFQLSYFKTYKMML